MGKTRIIDRIAGNNYIDISTLGFGKWFLTNRLYLIFYKLKGNHFSKISYDAGVNLYLWDTNGQQYAFGGIHGLVLHNSNFQIIVFGLDSQESFEGIGHWIGLVMKYVPQKDINMILVGNKSDEERKVNSNDIEKVLKEHNIKYFEVSAKNNINISELFEYIKDDVIRKT